MEKKFKDNVFSKELDGTNGDIFLLNGIDQGSSASQRIGEVLTIDQIIVPIIMESEIQTPVTVSGLYSIEIVWDDQPNGTLPSFPELYNTGKDPLSLRNLGRRDRFHTLYTSGPILLGNEGDANTPDSIAWKITIPKVSLKATYTASGDTIASIGTGSLLLVVRNDGVAGRKMTTFRSHPRIRYHDGKGGETFYGFPKTIGGQHILNSTNR